MRHQRTRRMAESQRLFEEALDEPLTVPPLPWTARQVIHDGPRWQFFDAKDRPVLGDFLRDPEDAAWLLKVVNLLDQLRQIATREQVREQSDEYRAMREVVLAARQLRNIEGNGIDELKKALEFFEAYWTDAKP